jgi:hypothetical protein
VRSWWNGKRLVLIVVTQDGAAVASEVRDRARGKCTACRRGFTVYAGGEYPRRVFQPDVVARVVAAHAVGAHSAAAAAASAGASATSARRWTRWVAALIAVGELTAIAAQLDAESVHGAGIAGFNGDGVRAMATRALSALESLGEALIHTGAKLVSATGLGRLLEWQFREHGVWVPLTARAAGASPRMVIQR